MDNINIPVGFNLADLVKLSKTNPQYASMFQGLYQIDSVIKKFVEDEIERLDDPDVYYIKTELMNQCYNLYLFSTEREAVTGCSWALSDFLIKCENKSIEKEVIEYTRKMIDKFNNSKHLKKSSDGSVNWIY